MEPPGKKTESLNTWRDHGQCFYDFMYENYLDWPVTSLQWGPILQSTSEYNIQRMYFSCRTDGLYNNSQNTWQNTPNYIVMATVEIANEGYYFINDLKSLFNHDSAKKHPNLKIKQVITHPGEVTVIRTSPANRKILASKSDSNEVFLWTSDKYKVNVGTQYSNVPELILDTYRSNKPNYALRFAPSLPRVLTASGDRIELFDIENPQPTKRELGSMMNNNSIKPLLSLQGHDKVEDFAFKNNQVWITGGQDHQIAIWDFRMKSITNRIADIHQHDINAVSVRNNYILSGGEQGRINIIDDRKLEVVYRKQTHKPIHSAQFHPSQNFFGIGNDFLSIYSLDQIQQKNDFTPNFIHHGMKQTYPQHSASINQFDWNHDSPMTVALTCQELDLENPQNGGVIHFFKLQEMFYGPKEDTLYRLQEAYQKLTLEERNQIDEYL